MELSPQHIEFAIKIAIALFPVVLFFAYYFRNFVFQQSILLQLKNFFLGMIFSIFAILLQGFLPSSGDGAVKAFVHAAMVEEVVRYIFIFFIIKKSSETFTVTEGVFDGILIGLGFSFAENIHYSFKYDGFVILLRCVSSVPMHVFTSGVMAYFLAYRHHCNEDNIKYKSWNPLRKRKWKLALIAFLIPYFYHAAFDFILFIGGNQYYAVWNYAMPVLLILGFVEVEYLVARGRLVISKNVLSMLNLDADDMDIIQRQKESEKWMMDTQLGDEPPPSLFINKWTLFNTLVGLFLTLFAVTMGALYYRDPEIFVFARSIPREILLSLIVWLPLAMGLIIIIADKINYLFFRQNMLRLPRASIITVKGKEIDVNSIILDILPYGIFLAGIEGLKVGDPVELEFYNKKQKAITNLGIVRWLNEHEAGSDVPLGLVIRFTTSSRAFKRFLKSYNLSKLKRRLLYSFSNTAANSV